MKAEKNIGAHLVHIGGPTLPNLRKPDFLRKLTITWSVMTIVLWTTSLYLGGLHTDLGLLAFSMPPLVVLARLYPDIACILSKEAKLTKLFFQTILAQYFLKRKRVETSRLRKRVRQEWRQDIAS